MMDDVQITRETLVNIQRKVIELMSATLELNKQLHALTNIELYEKRIKELQDRVETLESEIAETDIRGLNNFLEVFRLEDDLHFEQCKNRSLQMEIDKLKRESQLERKYVEQINW